jgi:tetratricopeptide (TPR) repeat protein
MMFSIPRRCCVVTIFATVVCMLSSPLLADLITARIALQTRQFELALAQAEDLAATHPFDSAMISARAHVELRQFQDARTAATRAQRLAPKLAGPRILKALALHGLGQPRRAMFHLRRALDLSTERNERLMITRLLRQIQAGLAVKLSGGLGIAPSSNINKISYSTTHTSINPFTGTLQTIPWTASEAQHSGTGLRFWSGLSYTLPKTQFGTQSTSLNLSPPMFIMNRASIAAL